MMGVTYFFLLSCLGLAITVQAQDCPRPVPGPNMDLKDNDINKQTFPDGTSVSFACTVGYTPTGGSPSITCSAGKWSEVSLKCERKNCGSVGEVSNGHVDYPEGTEFGDKAVITCEAGYTIVGKSEIVCGDQGWMGRLPSCEVVTCDPPSDFVDGSFSPKQDQYSYRDVVIYSCKTDYTLNGSKSRTCSEDGTFKPDPPKCVTVQCGDPVVVNGDWVEGSRPPYRHLSTVKLQCRSGYEMKGEQTQTCDINSKWSPGLPTCERSVVTSTTTTTTSTSTTTTTKNPIDDDGDGTPNSGVVTGVVVVLVLGIIIAIVAIVMAKNRKNKKTQGSGRGSPDREDTKDETERVALSEPSQPC